MKVRVRFAPSPTGYLHIGGARTALYCLLYARATGGEMILRIEDTDLDRSSKEYELSQVKALEWLGIIPDEGPHHGGKFAPYRQSERLDIYKKHALELVKRGHAFHCFCSEEVLAAKKEAAERENRAPVYDGTCHALTSPEIEKRHAAGEFSAIRFKVPAKSYKFTDHVRGTVEYPEGMVGDFVILRSNGIPVYNYCCVIDDWLMQMTHVIRAEEHLPNTLRQLMLYEAFGVKLPEFAHLSLLVGDDHQKLSKRHGATSVDQFRQESFLPEALCNYLCLLGWSHPSELDYFQAFDLGKLFDLTRFVKSPAVWDVEKLKYINGQHLRHLPSEKLLKHAADFVPSEHAYHQQSDEWKLSFLTLFKEHIHLMSEVNQHFFKVFGLDKEDTPEYRELMAMEQIPVMKSYLQGELGKHKDGFVSAAIYDGWQNHIKGELKIKGKPLFKGIRALLTGRAEGPDLKFLIPLTPVSILKQRLQNT